MSLESNLLSFKEVTEEEVNQYHEYQDSIMDDEYYKNLFESYL